MVTTYPTTSIPAIEKEARNTPAFRRYTANTIRQFSTNLSLVAHNIRTGYLLDLFTPKDSVEVFSRLLSVLRSNAETKDLFENVVHVYEASSEQSFFINARLLAERIEEILQADQSPIRGQLYPAFVCLGHPIKLLDAVPAGVVQLLQALRSLDIGPRPLSFSLPIHTMMQDAVPLAAVLLDYPVAYVPSTDHINVLGGVPLDFYECFLTFPNDISVPLSKFSCPSNIEGEGTDGVLVPDKIVDWLQKIFSVRLLEQNAVIDIGHTVQTLDHVTF